MSTDYSVAIAAEQARLEDAIAALKIISFGLCGDLAALHGDQHGANDWQHAQLLCQELRERLAVQA